jgi:hypothetical protein
MRTFTALLRALHKKVRYLNLLNTHERRHDQVPYGPQSSAFKDVVLWNHSSAMQSFIVNVPLLEAKLAGLTKGIEQCVFVHLHDSDDYFSVVSNPPDAIGPPDYNCLVQQNPRRNPGCPFENANIDGRVTRHTIIHPARGLNAGSPGPASGSRN